MAKTYREAKTSEGKMTNVKCGWCGEFFPMNTDHEKNGYSTHICPHCYRVVRSSRKEKVENPINRKHVHFDLREGDVV